MSRVKLLWLGHFLPWPPHGGSFQRSFNLIRELSREFEVAVLTFTQRGLCPTEAQRQAATQALSNFCSNVEVAALPSDESSIRWYWLLASNLLSLQPYSTQRFDSSEFRERLQRMMADLGPDIVYADTVAVAHHAVGQSGATVLNHHNIESSLLLQRAASETNPVKKWYIGYQGRKLARWERQVCPQFNLNLTVSDPDARRLHALAPDSTTAVVPNGTDSSYFQPSDQPEEASLFFAGSGSWYPNRDAVTFFLNEVWPAVSEAMPKARVDLVGHHPPSRAVELSRSDKRVRAHGFVEDIRPLLSRAAVCIVPIRVGGGTRLKILDAFAAGKAVVSTTIGCEGIECTDGRDIVVADTPEDFSRAVIELLRNSERRRQLGRQGRKLVEHMYGWDVIGRRMRSELKKLL